jgi:hypothetical protein
LNWADVAKLWVPALVVVAIIGYVIVNAAVVGLGTAYLVVLWILGVVTAVWLLHATLIASFFSFRTRDVARLAGYYLLRKPGASLGAVAMLIVAGGVVWFSNDLILAVLGGLWVWFWYRSALPIAEDVAARFTDSGTAAPAG